MKNKKMPTGLKHTQPDGVADVNHPLRTSSGEMRQGVS